MWGGAGKSNQKLSFLKNMKIGLDDSFYMIYVYIVLDMTGLFILNPYSKSFMRVEWRM